MADMFEEALKSIGAAIGDVREKVVEEGWFGRTVTDGQSAPEATTPTPENSNAFDEILAQKLQEAAVTLDRSHDTPEPGGGMEH